MIPVPLVALFSLVSPISLESGIGDTAEVFMNGTGQGQTISRSCRLENPVPSGRWKMWNGYICILTNLLHALSYERI